MADEADRGNDAADLFLATALAALPKQSAIQGIGICLNCGAELQGDARWCDADCRDDWERHAKKP